MPHHRVRVLCLHGMQQTADVFRDKISKMVRTTASLAEYDFLDAPFELPLAIAGDMLPMRSWYKTDAVSDESAESEWVSVLRDAMQKAAMQDRPYSVVFGFSQGCSVILDALRYNGLLTGVKGVILAGCPGLDTSSADGLRRALEDSSSGATAGRRSLESLHFIGLKDTVTPPEGSMAVAACFCGSKCVVTHEHAHSVPQSQDACRALELFLMSFLDPAVEQQLLADVAEEIEMLQLMYEGENCEVLWQQHQPTVNGGASSAGMPPVLRTVCGKLALVELRVRIVLSDGDTTIVFRVIVPRTYPDDVPDIDVSADTRRATSSSSSSALQKKTDLFLTSHRRAIVNALSELYEDMEASYLGAPMLAPLLSTARDRMDDVLQRAAACSPDADAEDEATSSKLPWWEAEECADPDKRRVSIAAARAALRGVSACDNHATDSAATLGSSNKKASAPHPPASACGGGGGSWSLCIGLIGKPSAGKSTFFNAITDPVSEAKAAKVAAFPFTTIEPNIGAGFFPCPCPCTRLSNVCCQPEYGHVSVDGTLCRRLPVIVKDVAGLVKGAYQGKGKGNRFLNDLCDADVLVHVVDGAAATDADGAACTPGEGTTAEDISWVSDEVHSWIYDNIRSKWGTIIRRPEKLLGMFSGYQASNDLVERALQRVGVRNTKELLLKAPLWQSSDLHILIASFVALRFPVVVALNKADLPSAGRVAAALRNTYHTESDAFVPMSARAECTLLDYRRRGWIQYVSGDDHVTCIDAELPSEVAQKPQWTALLAFLKTRGGTGVQSVVKRAIELCRPLYIVPVDDLRSLVSAAPGKGLTENRSQGTELSASSTTCAGPSAAGALAHMPLCLVMKHGSTADDVFRAFVRAMANLSAALGDRQAISSCGLPSSVLRQDQHQQLKLVRFEHRIVHLSDATFPSPFGDCERGVVVLRKDDVVQCGVGEVSFVHIMANQRLQIPSTTR